MQSIRLIYLSLMVLLLVGCQKSMDKVDFNNIQLPNSPNYALVAPRGFTPSPTIDAPQYSVSKEDLQRIMLSVIHEQPRIKPIMQNTKVSEYSFVQRTAVFRFPDQIDVKFIEHEGHGSLIMLSRSMYGYSDLGKNKKRMKQWLELLSQALANQTDIGDR